MKVTTFLFDKLGRTGLTTGAFLSAILLPAMAVALTTPESGQPAVIAGLGHVIDGDTLDIGQTRIRLEGVDAPEMAQTCQTATGENWDCGRKAAALLRTLAEQRDLACDRTGIDKYGRTLAICYEDGVNVNEAMVRAGLAWAFVKYSTEFVAVEAEAKSRKIGVWQGAAEAPWDFRHRELRVAEKSAPKDCAIKGNISSRGHIYHLQWSPWYDRVNIDEARGERWFCSEAEAQAAGWRPASSN
jgi:endonuclease YncB( thermonuclease family)